jgi:uncharacterized protein YbjT (DUF2867 family)
MKVLVVGATGQTGRLVVKQLVEKGKHKVTVLVRRPSAVETYGNKVTVIRGDATNAADLQRALTGQAAVISTLGTKSLRNNNLETLFMTALTQSVARRSIRRFVNQSGWGAGGSAGNDYLLMKLMRRTIMNNIYNDKDRGEALLFASKLPYINVRPSRLTNGPAMGQVKASLSGQGMGHRISRADVASFLITQLSDDQWIGQSPLISYPKT